MLYWTSLLSMLVSVYTVEYLEKQHSNSHAHTMCAQYNTDTTCSYLCIGSNKLKPAIWKHKWLWCGIVAFTPSHTSLGDEVWDCQTASNTHEHAKTRSSKLNLKWFSVMVMLSICWDHNCLEPHLTDTLYCLHHGYVDVKAFSH